MVDRSEYANIYRQEMRHWWYIGMRDISLRLLDVAYAPRDDLLILDAQRLAEGPLATVRMPFRIYTQIHGWWVSGGVRQGKSG